MSDILERIRYIVNVGMLPMSYLNQHTPPHAVQTSSLCAKVAGYKTSTKFGVYSTDLMELNTCSRASCELHVQDVRVYSDSLKTTRVPEMRVYVQ